MINVMLLLMFRDSHSLIPSDSHQGYKQLKAKIGQSRVRPWKWMSFANPARKDGAIFYHWRRVADEGAEYPFARFNKVNFCHLLVLALVYQTACFLPRPHIIWLII